DDDDDSSGDDADDEDEDGEEEEEEHLALADFAVVIPTDEIVSLPEGTKPYEVGESSMASLTGGQGIDYGFVSTLDAKARRRGIGEVGYGIRDTWIDPTETVPEIAPMTVGEDAQDSRTRISQRIAVDSQRVNLLIEDMIAH
nr:hypothetical protein [Tanacetum cinerariifolium]